MDTFSALLVLCEGNPPVTDGLIKGQLCGVVSWNFDLYCIFIVAMLTRKQQETNVCILSTVTTDALVLKHQAISNKIAV